MKGSKVAIAVIVYLLLTDGASTVFAKPLKKGKLTSKFGPRIHPITKKASNHNGIDIGSPNGTPIHSVLAGKVARVGFDDISGNHAVIESGAYRIGYAHMQELPSVKLGDLVEQDQQIGLVGSTGRSTGNHLHLTVKKNGVAVDPLLEFPGILP